jgi:serine/threonine protein phosphatase PrpC
MKRSLDLMRFGGDTDTGIVREQNEDRLLLLPDIGVFAVVDGMGGESAGEKAAEIAVAVLKANFLRSHPAATSAERIRQVRLAILDANNRIHEMAAANEEWAGMACVLTVAVVAGDRVTVGHVGDSRLYRIDREKIEKLTRDHSPVGMREDAHELTEIQAMRDSRRHEVLRDVGSQLRRADDDGFADVFETTLDPDSALLLCSDGLSDMVMSARIRDVVLLHAGDPVRSSRELIRIANEAGGRDNVSAIVIEGSRFKESIHAPSQRPVEEERGWLAGALRPLASRPAIFLYGALAGIGLFFYLQLSSLSPTAGNRVQTLRVSAVGGSFVTISEALLAAGPGDRIEVEPGEYRESVVLRNGITLISTVPHAAVIRPPSAGGQVTGILGEGIEANMSGFRIQPGDGGLEIGIRLKDATVQVTNMEIGPASVAGILIDGNTAGVIRGNTVESGAGISLAVRGTNDVRIELNWFSRSLGSHPTIEIAEGSLAHLVRNLIEGPATSVRAPVSLHAEITADNRLIPESRRPGGPSGQEQ